MNIFLQLLTLSGTKDLILSNNLMLGFALDKRPSSAYNSFIHGENHQKRVDVLSDEYVAKQGWSIDKTFE